MDNIKEISLYELQPVLVKVTNHGNICRKYYK